MTPDSALPLILMTLGAVAMPSLARLTRIPVAIAEIAYGLVLGVSGFQLVGSDKFIGFLADVGFAFFMFLAGLEIDFRGIGAKGVRRGLISFALSLGSLALVFVAGGLLGWPLWVSLAAGATSVGLLVAVVRESGIGGTPLGNAMLGQAAIGEAVTIIALSFFHIHHEAHDVLGFVVGTARMLGLVLAVVIVLVVLRTSLWWFPAPFKRMVAHDDPSEFGVRVGFGLMFAFVGLSMLAGVEPFLGAFIAGTMLTFVIREKGALEHKLASMAYGFFVPIFFIHVGMRLDLSPSLIAREFPTIAAVVGVMLLAKIIPTLYYLRQGLSLADVFSMSALLAAPLTLLIAIVDIGVRIAKTITPQALTTDAGVDAAAAHH